jgi:uncharacterized protein
MKAIAITGASGFVGTSLTKYFSKLGYRIVPISRDILNNQQKLEETLNSSEIVINLAGANIINRWSESYKKLLYSSRLDTMIIKKHIVKMEIIQMIFYLNFAKIGKVKL